MIRCIPGPRAGRRGFFSGGIQWQGALGAVFRHFSPRVQRSSRWRHWSVPGDWCASAGDRARRADPCGVARAGLGGRASRRLEKLIPARLPRHSAFAQEGRCVFDECPGCFGSVGHHIHESQACWPVPETIRTIPRASFSQAMRSWRGFWPRRDL